MFELWIFFVGLVMLTSVPFIIATILVYILIPQLLNLVGKCVVCYLANLGSFYIIVAFVQIKGAKEEPIDEKLCTFLGYLIYFLQRSTFAWSSVISFDLCFNFRYACCNSISVLLNKVRIFSLSLSFISRNTMKVKKMSETKRLWLYSLFAYSLASVLTIVCYAVDSIESLPSRYKPQIGVHVCGIQRK